MAVIPQSQVALCRQRRHMADALDRLDWEAVKSSDVELINAVDLAADDPQRDLGELLQELKAVVGLYKQVLNQCELDVRLKVEDGP